MGGDFNLALSSSIDRYPVRDYKDAHVPDLESLIDTFDLHDACRKLYPSRPFFSFRRGQTKSRIDHFFISKNCIIDSYQHQDFSSSDHDIISVSVIIQNTLCRGKGFWKNRTKIYDSENFIDKFKEFWDENLRKNWKRYSGSWWLETKFQIKKCLIKMNKEFEDTQNEEIISTKLSLERKKFLANMDPENKSLSKKYYECKEDLAKKQISMIQNKVMHDQVFDITHGDLPTKTFFEKLKKLKSNCEPKQVYTEDGTIEKNPIKVVHVARDFFEKKFKRSNISHRHLEKFLNQLPVLENDDVDRLNLMRPADFEELYDTVMSFKNGRLPSLDGLTIEFYKKSFEIIKHQLLNFFNDSIFVKRIPRKINTGVLK